MQETCNNCLGLKKCSTTLLQAKTVKHECRNAIATTLLLLLRFSTRNNCCEFLAFYGVTTQSVIQSFYKTPVCGASLSYVIHAYYIMFQNYAHMTHSLCTETHKNIPTRYDL